MIVSSVFFYSFLAFIFGVFLSSICAPPFLSIIIGLIIEVVVFLLFFEFKKISFFFLLIIPFVIMGFCYSSFYDAIIQKKSEGLFIRNYFSGEVGSFPKESFKSKTFILKEDCGAKIFVITDVFSNISYGDRIIINGDIEPITEKNKYLKKDNISGVLYLPQIEFISKIEGFSLKKHLFDFRNYFASVFERVFNRDEASLALGLLLGQQSANFSDELKEDMKRSGTTHLVALSGYNIAILVSSFYLLFGFIFRRRWNFIFSLSIIFVFVVMTGAEASVVRAAIMGLLVIVAQNLSRIYSFKNAVVFAAFFMILLNPNILLFDLGFILSFLALFGINYLSPTISSFFVIPDNFWGFLEKTFFDTFSAQLFVLPILALYFGSVSFAGLFSNVILLPLVPYSMLLVFLVGFLGLFSFFLAQVFSFFAYLLIYFEVMVIKIFSSFSMASLNFGIFAVVIYYLILIFFIFKNYYKVNEAQPF